MTDLAVWWPTIIGLCIASVAPMLAFAAVFMKLGATNERIGGLQTGQTTLFQKVEELQRDLKNGINTRLSDHSKEIDVVKMGLVSMKEAMHTETEAVRFAMDAAERNIQRNCDLRHGVKAKA